MVKDAQNAHKQTLQLSDSDKFDQVVIQDRKPLHSVEPHSSTDFLENKPATPLYRQLAASAAADSQAMIDKLKSEIAHLEKWLSHQKSGRQRSSLSVANTIRALIATRQSLLDSLEKRLR